MFRTLQTQVEVALGMLYLLYKLRGKHLQQDSDLIPIILVTRSKISTDLRDQVYALLGLVTMDVGYEIVPDYVKNIPTTYSEIVRYQLDTTKSLSVLAFVLDKNPDLKLPSWLPDWSCDQKEWTVQSTRLDASKAYSTCSDHRFNGRIFDHRILGLQGYHHSTVTACGTMFTREAFDLSSMAEWASRFSDECVEDVLLGGIKMLEIPIDPRVKIDAEFRKQYLAQIRNPYLEPLRHLAMNELMQIIQRVLTRRRFFDTYLSNMPGVGPPDISVGDEIWIVAGGNTPLILRPSNQTFRSPEDDSIEHKCYTFIGDCYLYGVMKGEAAWKLKDSSVDVFLV